MGDNHDISAVTVVDGWPFSKELQASVEQVVVDEHVLLPAMFAITMHDPKQQILDKSGLRVGAEVEISVGQDKGQKPLIKGEVVAVECDYDELGGRIVARGYAASHRLHHGRRTRTFLDTTDSDIVKRVANEAEIEIDTIEPTTEVYSQVTQANLSDWDFLANRARQNGFELAMVEGKLHFGSPQKSADAPDQAEVGPDADAPDDRQLIFGKKLVAFHGRLSAAEQVAEVEVRGWDAKNKRAVVGTATAGTIAAKLELAEPSSMAGLFGDATFVSVSRNLSSDREAEAAARAIADRIGSVFAEVDGTARGNPVLRAGTPVSLSGVGEDFSGKYVLSHVRHVIGAEGYRTHFTASGRSNRSLLGLVSSAPGHSTVGSGPAGSFRISGFVRGLVEDSADPLKEGRVKVSLPWLAADFVTDWAPVMQMGAGPKSGTMFIPSVGDEVLVGFEFGDIDHPIVVGGLFNSIDMPPTYEHLLDNGAVLGRSIVSRLGHEITFNDGREHSGITLSTDGATVGVNLNALDQKLSLRSDGSIEIHSDGELKVSASKISLVADGELVLKGARISLN